MIHVALCLTDITGNYYKHALVTALSVLENTKSSVCLHLVRDETLSDKAESLFKSVFRQYGQEIRLYNAADVPEETVKNIPHALSKGAMYRTMLPTLVREPKILYLDCDIICLADVADVFSFDILKYYFGAVKMEPQQGRQWAKKLHLTCDFCINSGVMLMNLDKIRRDVPDYTQKLFTIGANAPVKIGDQGAINILFDNVPDTYLFLPERFNLRTLYHDHSTWQLSAYYGHMIHFVGSKPWQNLTLPGLFYWKYYARLFPEENVFELMEQLTPHEFSHLFSFILRGARRRRMARRWYELETKGIRRTILDKIRKR